MELHKVTEMCEHELGTFIVDGQVVVEIESFAKVHPARNAGPHLSPPRRNAT